jgi:hypothetical protein
LASGERTSAVAASAVFGVRDEQGKSSAGVQEGEESLFNRTRRRREEVESISEWVH